MGEVALILVMYAGGVCAAGYIGFVLGHNRRELAESIARKRAALRARAGLA